MWLPFALGCVPTTPSESVEEVPSECPEFPTLMAYMPDGQGVEAGAELPVMHGPEAFWMLPTRVRMDVPAGTLGYVYAALMRSQTQQVLGSRRIAVKTASYDAPCQSDEDAALYFYFREGVNLPEDLVCQDLLLVYGWEPDGDGPALLESYPVVLVLAEAERADPDDPCTDLYP